MKITKDKNLDLTKLITNTAGAGMIGTYLPDILAAVPPKYHAYIGAGVSVIVMLASLFQNKPISNP